MEERQAAMSSELHDFGRADLLDAEAIGQPGNRRFRLFARSPRGTASLWLEREQMEALSLAIDQLLAQVTGEGILRPEAQAEIPRPPGAPEDFPEQPDVEFRVSQLTLGYDEDHDAVVLLAAPIEFVEDGNGDAQLREDVAPQFAARISRQQAMRLSSHITGALAGGRPRCPLCGAPTEPAHVCIKQNGFHPVELN
jgi:uncharacterized repeat protein (TIGR03847 family)